VYVLFATVCSYLKIFSVETVELPKIGHSSSSNDGRNTSNRNM